MDKDCPSNPIEQEQRLVNRPNQEYRQSKHLRVDIDLVMTGDAKDHETEMIEHWIDGQNDFVGPELWQSTGYGHTDDAVQEKYH